MTNYHNGAPRNHEGYGGGGSWHNKADTKELLVSKLRKRLTRARDVAEYKLRYGWVSQKTKVGVAAWLGLTVGCVVGWLAGRYSG